VDERLPAAPLRHWVLTLPHPVRYRRAFDGHTLSLRPSLGAYHFDPFPHDPA